MPNDVTLLYTGTYSDGVVWKENYESIYTEVMELGR